MQGLKTFGPQLVRGDAKFIIFLGDAPDSKQNNNNLQFNSNLLISMMEKHGDQVKLEKLETSFSLVTN
jgi:hypothetical protein